MSAFDKIIGYDLVKGELRPLGQHRRGARKKALPDLRRLQEDQSGLCGIILSFIKIL